MELFDQNIYISCGNSMYNLMNLRLAKDGSLVISLVRKGKSENVVETDILNNKITYSIGEDKGRRRTKKITYHTSGLVNFHDLKHRAKKLEPLHRITSDNFILVYSIPCIEKLDIVDDVDSNALIIPFGNESFYTRINLGIFVTMDKSELDQFECIQVGFERDIHDDLLYKLVILPLNFEYEIPEENPCFIYVSEQYNYSGKLISSREQRNIMADYYARKLCLPDFSGICLGPDKNDYFTIVFATEMYRKPDIENLRFREDGNNYSLVEDKQCSNEKRYFKFRIKDKAGNNITDISVLENISFNAEI